MSELIRQNLMRIRSEIARACNTCGRRPEEITIVAITKTYPIETISQAVALGLTEIGESRIQEAEPKIRQLGPIARYHLVGHLQTNKVKKAIPLFDMIQSVDSFYLAEEISRRAVEANSVIDCLVELNSSGEPQKYGVAPEQVTDLVGQLGPLPGIRVRGLMTVGPLTDDEAVIRRAFRETRQIFDNLRGGAGEAFRILSMGMSHDFPMAIEEGTTMVRIGTSLFGARGA
jgi:PLP dependent protein